MSTANDITQLAKQDFMDRNRDLLALVKSSSNDVFRRIAAALALNSEAQTDCLLYVDAIDQGGFAGQVAREDLQRELYRAICKAFIRIQHNHVVEFVSRLTPEALAQLEAIEVVAGLRQAPAPVAPPPPPKSAAELLTEEVLRDWEFLPVDKVKHKMNNRAYKAEFDRLSAENLLDTQITSLHDGGQL
jgi:hypothetical protein